MSYYAVLVFYRFTFLHSFDLSWIESSGLKFSIICDAVHLSLHLKMLWFVEVLMIYVMYKCLFTSALSNKSFIWWWISAAALILWKPRFFLINISLPEPWHIKWKMGRESIPRAESNFGYITTIRETKITTQKIQRCLNDII